FVLVTGPTGSGKSTTLAAMIDRINEERHEHIMTVEDPIEFLHRHKNCVVNQRELGSDAHSFSHALKAALRQDPDVILVGEMRDPTPAVRNLIREGKTHQIYSALQTGGAHGMQTMDAALVELVRTSKITRELAQKRSSTPDELMRLMGNSGLGPQPPAPGMAPAGAGMGQP